MALTKIRKRDGRIVEFRREKIADAIYKALRATNSGERHLADALADVVVTQLHKVYSDENVPSVEDVQDYVERILIDEGLATVAKAYIIYRQERKRIREEKKRVLQKESLDDVDKAFDVNALRVLASRYLFKDEQGRIIESPRQLFERIATSVAIPDVLRDASVFDKSGGQPRDGAVEGFLRDLDRYDGRYKIGPYRLNKWHFETIARVYRELVSAGQMKVGFGELLSMLERGELDGYSERIKAYYELMAKKDFMPNSPTIMNAGARLGQLSACFVLDIGDDLRSIMKAASDAALIFQSGGGVGINYSKLRPEGDIVASTSGVASGPVSFMNIIDTVTEVVKQGGKRRGANMAELEVWHPDIEKFVAAKQKPGVLENHNVSVGVWSDFWEAWRRDGDKSYALRNPRTGEITAVLDAGQLMDRIAFSAWDSAEPGVVFFDRMNEYNVLKPVKGLLRATNPCSEQPLYPYESCNLGSVNLANFVKVNGGHSEFDWERYESVIRICTCLLDNVIDANKYPIPEIEENTKATRKIGLGVMGLADLFFKLGIPYDSPEGYELMNRLAEALSYYTIDESVKLAVERGPYPLLGNSEYVEGRLPMAGCYELKKAEWNYDWERLAESAKKEGVRNSMTTTVAPTGSISMIAGTSNGIEPLYALVYEKHVAVGKFYYANNIFEEELNKRGLYSEELLQEISDNYGSAKGLERVPEDLQKVFVTAMDVHWSDHVLAQAVWQRWINSAISKTINMPTDITVEDVKGAYMLAYALGCKGVTVYRDLSRHAQVLHVVSAVKQRKVKAQPSAAVFDAVRRQVLDPYLAVQLEKVLGAGPQPAQAPKPQVLSVGVSTEGSRPAEGAKSSSHFDSCPLCASSIVHEAGCTRCLHCGWSVCE